MAHTSPSSSPRLPSPPPMAEDQITSPQIRAPNDPSHLILANDVEQGAVRRIRPGTKASEMNEGPPLVDLKDINTPFQLTEHLKALHNHYTHPENSPTIAAIDRYMASQLAEAPDGIEKALWLYELCRFLVQKVNIVVVALFADVPPCSAQTCSEMRASEWQYLCAVHDPPKPCCAIDYCCHTLDSAANTLSSPKHFPSRLALGLEVANTQNQIRQLTNIFRRVYRIFAHAWFQHREVFWRVEGKTGLYVLFKTVCDTYNLIPEDNYTIPPEAEGLQSLHEAKDAEQPSYSVLRRDGSSPTTSEDLDGFQVTTEPMHSATTRRHRQNPSKGSFSVATVIEENEDDTEIQEWGTGRAGEAGFTEDSTKINSVVTEILQSAEPGPQVEGRTTIERTLHDLAIGENGMSSNAPSLQRADTARRNPDPPDTQDSADLMSIQTGRATDPQAANDSVAD